MLRNSYGKLYDISILFSERTMTYRVGQSFKVGSDTVEVHEIYKESNIEEIKGDNVYIVDATINGETVRNWKVIENCPVVYTPFLNQD